MGHSPRSLLLPGTDAPAVSFFPQTKTPDVVSHTKGQGSFNGKGSYRTEESRNRERTEEVGEQITERDRTKGKVTFIT